MTKQKGIAEGWHKRGFQLPDALDAQLSDEAEMRSYNSVKLIGTAAVAMYLGLPSDVRARVFASLLELHAEGPDAFTPESVWDAVWSALHASAFNRGIKNIFSLWVEPTLTGRWAKDKFPLLPNEELYKIYRGFEDAIRSGKSEEEIVEMILNNEFRVAFR